MASTDTPAAPSPTITGLTSLDTSQESLSPSRNGILTPSTIIKSIQPSDPTPTPTKPSNPISSPVNDLQIVASQASRAPETPPSIPFALPPPSVTSTQSIKERMQHMSSSFRLSNSPADNISVQHYLQQLEKETYNNSHYHPYYHPNHRPHIDRITRDAISHIPDSDASSSSSVPSLSASSRLSDLVGRDSYTIPAEYLRGSTGGEGGTTPSEAHAAGDGDEAGSLNASSAMVSPSAGTLNILPSGPKGGAYVDITEYLNCPQSEAAQKLGVPTSTLSKRWKEAVRGRKWPFRTVAKLDKEIMTLLHNIPQGQGAPPLPEDVESLLGQLLRRRQEELKPVVIRL